AGRARPAARRRARTGPAPCSARRSPRDCPSMASSRRRAAARRRPTLAVDAEVYDRPVTGRNDRASGFLAAPSPVGVVHARAPARVAAKPGQPESPGLDLLSDVLRGVRLTAAVFFRVEAASPWVIEMPDGAALARSVFPRAQHVVSYHVVTRGTCWGGLVGGTSLPLEPGDVLVFPHGDPY